MEERMHKKLTQQYQLVELDNLQIVNEKLRSIKNNQIKFHVKSNSSNRNNSELLKKVNDWWNSKDWFENKNAEKLVKEPVANL